MLCCVDPGQLRSRGYKIPQKNFDEIFKTLCMFKKKGGDIAEALDTVLSIIGGFWCEEDFNTSGIESLTLVMDFLASERVEDAWRWLLQRFGRSMFRPSEQSQNFLRSAIRTGLGPNRHIGYRTITKTTHNKDREHHYSVPLLGTALFMMSQEKKEETYKEANTISEKVSQENDVQVNKDGTLTLPLWCIISTLIEAGADIYYMYSEKFDGPSSWLSICTLWDWASQHDVLNEWEAALRECGLNPDEVLREDVQRCKQAFRLHGATRTGVDEEILALPSAAGLRCRICRSKYCTEHGTKTFFYGY
jgi:hypothetical protein